MATNERITDLPTVTNSSLSDIIYAVQGYVSPSNLGTSVQETMQQVFNLMLANIVLHNAGNPNGAVAGVIYQFCWDTTNHVMYVCTTSGSTSTAIWTALPPGAGITPPASGGTGVASPTAHTLPVAEGSSNFNFLGPLTNGQLLIGSTGVDPSPATITAGANISVTNGAGSITIAATGAGSFAWTHVTGTSQTMASFNGYVADNAGLVTLALPATSALGDEIIIMGRGSGGWSISQAAGQQIIWESSSSSVGVPGSVSSINRRNSIYMVCTAANTEWTIQSSSGNLTFA